MRKGFTLIELMIVVVIIGILAALAIPRFMQASLKSKVSEAKPVLKQILIAAQAYYQESGQYPPTVNDLFDNLSTWTDLGISVDQPTGKARFQYNVTTGGTDGFAAVAIPVGAEGTNAASSRELADQALISKVTSVTIDEDGNINVNWK